MICSNYYNQKTDKVEPKADCDFRMVISKENYFLQHSFNELLISKDVEDEVNDSVKFQLTKKKGFLILAGNNILTTENGEVDQSDSQELQLKSASKNQTSNLENGMIWTPVPKDRDSAIQDMPFFYMQQPYGFKQPRLLSRKRGGITQSLSSAYKRQAIVSSNLSDGYQCEENAVWKIYRVLK